MFPVILPGGQALLVTISDMNGSVENSRVAVLNLASGEYEVLVQGGSNPWYSASGHLAGGHSVAGDPESASIRPPIVLVRALIFPVLITLY